MLATPTGPLIKQEAWVYNITTSLVNIKCCTSDRKLLRFPPSDNIIPDSLKVADTVAAALIYLVIDLFQQIYTGLELGNSQLFTSHPSLFPFSLGHVCLPLTALLNKYGAPSSTLPSWPGKPQIENMHTVRTHIKQCSQHPRSPSFSLLVAASHG